MRYGAGDRLHKKQERDRTESRRDLTGQCFWTRVHLVSTTGRDDEVIKEYRGKQEDEDKRDDKRNLPRQEANMLAANIVGAALAPPVQPL